jgi:hypothetical protein
MNIRLITAVLFLTLTAVWVSKAQEQQQGVTAQINFADTHVPIRSIACDYGQVTCYLTGDTLQIYLPGYVGGVRPMCVRNWGEKNQESGPCDQIDDEQARDIREDAEKEWRDYQASHPGTSSQGEQP